MWWRQRRRDPPGELARALASATRARIIEGGVADGKALGQRVALELEGEQARTLAEYLRVVPEQQPFYCMCRGDWGIELYAGNSRLVTIGLHHGRSIRVDTWSSDALLADGEGLLRFLAQRGLREPLTAFEADRAAAARFADARARWLAATPKPLVDLLSALEGAGLLKPKSEGVLEALKRLEDSGAEPTSALLAWYAAGLGPWNGFPSYEGVACALLAGLGAERVARAAEATTNESELFAAARFFARWGAPPKERRLLTPALAERLRAVTQARGDADAQTRIQAALAPLDVPADGPSLGRAENDRDFAFVVAVNLPTPRPALVVLDGSELVLLEGGQRRVLLTGLRSVGAVATSGPRVVLTRLDRCEVVMVDPKSGDAETLAENVSEARCLAVSGERVAWIEKRNGWLVRELGRDQPWAKVDDRAWDLRIAGAAPVWGRAYSGVFGVGQRYETEIVTVGSRGKVKTLARFTGDENYVYPRFDADATRIACLTGREVTLVDRVSGTRRPLGLARRVESVALDGNALWVIALTEDRYGGELLRIDLRTGASDSRLSYRRMLYHQERLSLAANHVGWNVGGTALCVPRG